MDKNSDKLYRHAQPAPVVTFYRDGIEAAASYLDQQREAYDSEHGWSDPDTGSFEFGSEIKREYSSTLEELAEGIRALHPNAGNSPAIPDGYVMVPKEPTEAMLAAAKEWTGLTSTAEAVYIKMLEAAPQPQNAPQNIPEIIPQWIPVSERVPENDGAYLCWDKRYVTTYAFIFGAWQANQFIAKNITHWMPLPAAPQEVK